MQHPLKSTRVTQLAAINHVSKLISGSCKYFWLIQKRLSMLPKSSTFFKLPLIASKDPHILIIIRKNCQENI